MLGLSRASRRARASTSIIAFAELEEFVDLKLKNYSSGMIVRLAFAIAIQVDAEILLIDEVLAVGDAAFQQKCFDEFFRLKREGRTIAVRHPRHGLGRALLRPRDAARARAHWSQIGDPREVARAYNELNFGQLPHEAPEVAAEVADASSTAIADAWFESRDGERVTSVKPGGGAEHVLRGPFRARTWMIPSSPRRCAPSSDTRSSWPARDQHGGQSGTFKAGETVTARFEIPSWLTPSRYA